MTAALLYTIGNLTIDDIVRWPGGDTWMNQAGGNVLFSALGARIWLSDVALIARLGHDYPRQHLQAIEARGIHPVVEEVNAPALHDWALYEADGARQFINHLNSGTNSQATIRAEEIPPEHLDGSAYHLAPVPTNLQAELLGTVKRSQCLVSLDPHVSWITGREDEIEGMLGQVDFFLPSEVEAERLYGSRDVEAAAQSLARLGPRAVVIKLGSSGSLVVDGIHNQPMHIPIYPAAAIDPTGAGDAYCGGFLAGYLLTEDPVAAAQYATVSASYIVETVGALAVEQPSPEEAQERLRVVVDRLRAGKN